MSKEKRDDIKKILKKRKLYCDLLELGDFNFLNDVLLDYMNKKEIEYNYKNAKKIVLKEFDIFKKYMDIEYYSFYGDDEENDYLTQIINVERKIRVVDFIELNLIIDIIDLGKDNKDPLKIVDIMKKEHYNFLKEQKNKALKNLKKFNFD